MTATGVQNQSEKLAKSQHERSSSFQMMLEMEHIRKLERLQGHQSMTNPPTLVHDSHMAFDQVLRQQINQSRSAQAPGKLSPFPKVHPPPVLQPLVPLHSRRMSSISLSTRSPEHLPSAMKAGRRPSVIPPLSISVPPAADADTRIDHMSEDRASSHQRHKTVTFLDLDEEKDHTSEGEESSICQSPSWEAFGQRKKKEKKNDAKMRKKDHTDLEAREAKSVKQKLTAKLHKVPPAPRFSSSSLQSANPMALADERLRPASIQKLEEQQLQFPRPQHARQRSDSVAMQLKAAFTGYKNQSQSNDEPSFIGGLKLGQERQAAAGVRVRKENPPTSAMSERVHSFGPEVKTTVSALPPPALPRSNSEGAELHMNRDPRRKSQHGSIQVPPWPQPLVSPNAPPVPDASKLQQWKDRSPQQAVSIITSGGETEFTLVEPSVDFEHERGRRRESYVHRHRQQSRERSINGYKDEIRVSSNRSHYPPQANRQHQARTHSSFSESIGARPPPRSGSLINLGSLRGQKPQDEDFLITFRLPYTPPVSDSQSHDNTRHGSHDGSKSRQMPMVKDDFLSKEIPAPSERLASRETLPLSHGGAIRGFKDAAKAAFQKVSTPTPPKPPVSSYFNQRARDATPDSTSSSRYSSTHNSPLPAQPVRPFAEHAESGMPSRESSARPTNRFSLSSFDDTPSSQSPATTPDSSRPQSEKGMPPVDEEIRRVDNEPVVVTNDERSYRHSHKAAMLTTSPAVSNARTSLPPQIPVQNHEAHLFELESLVSERFGRKASLSDGEHDCDVFPSPPKIMRSPESNTSTLTSPPAPAAVSVPQDCKNRDQDKGTEDVSKMVDEEIQSAVQRHPSLSKSCSSPDLALNSDFLPKLKHQPLIPRPLVPPRSSKRGSSPTAKSSSQRYFDEGSRNPVISLEGPSNPTSYLEQAQKSAQVPPRSGRTSRASIVPPDGKVEPVAKMLVECCNCKFLHDMPSKVYECMANPDGMVEDRKLGVSGIISTTVKCPWCSHGMTTKCCAGYAAVIYLKEKLH